MSKLERLDKLTDDVKALKDALYEARNIKGWQPEQEEALWSAHDFTCRAQVSLVRAYRKEAGLAYV